ncbi:MAG: molybdopterin-dependent oxidoreductase [Gammaproteobacteria bacterium]
MATVSRRDFLKYVGAGGVGAGAGFMLGESREHDVEYLVPQVEPPPGYVPGIAQYFNTACSLCSAGCGISVRIREGRAKKIEGNPLHPVSQGRTCAIGQAGLNVLYNPDRLRVPLKKNAAGEFEEITFDEALGIFSDRIAKLSADNRGSQLALVTGTVRGHLHELFSRFAEQVGSGTYLQYDFTSPENLYTANHISFGIEQLPYYDIAKADYLLSFGADLAGTWISPVHHSMGLGHMRRGRPRLRGRFVHVEPRMTLTAASADEWIPGRQGAEGLFALAIAHVVFAKSVGGAADPYSWSDALRDYAPERVAERIGVEADRIEKIADGLLAADAPLVLGGRSAANDTNGVSNLVAINALNYLLGNLGREGGIIFNPEPLLPAPTSEHRAGLKRMLELKESIATGGVDTLVTYNTNPAFNLPASTGFAEALDSVPFMVSLSSFMDETTAMADIILPVHSFLESWGDDAPEPGVAMQVASLSQPVVTALYETMPPGDVILAVAARIGGAMRQALPWTTFESFMKDGWRAMFERDHQGAGDFDSFFNQVARAGVWARTAPDAAAAATSFKADALSRLRFAEPQADGGEYPLSLQPYLSQNHLDGRGANLPWMQELPDPMTSIVYATWVELNPSTANEMGLKEGDVLRVRSESGEFEAPVFIFEAIRPDVVGVPIGQGHKHYGRYAQGRGANPLAILNAHSDTDSGALAWGATKVVLEKTGKRVRLIKTSGTSRDLGRNILGKEEIQFLGE